MLAFRRRSFLASLLSVAAWLSLAAPTSAQAGGTITLTNGVWHSAGLPFPARNVVTFIPATRTGAPLKISDHLAEACSKAVGAPRIVA